MQKKLTVIASILRKDQNTLKENSEIYIAGWVRHRRGNQNIAFISLNDGSSQDDFQIVLENQNDVAEKIHTGTSLVAHGILRKSPGQGQSIEMLAKTIEIIGSCDPEEYPIQPKKHSFEFLRENAHLRTRTRTFSSVFRLRHYLNFAIHEFFHKRNFYHIPTPIITSSDAEGAGEVFTVTSLNSINDNDPEIYKKDFFGKKANLTVSGQLEAESFALALSKVYTFGPTFRAENSNTSRHLAEFWMVEPEMAFYDLEDDMDLAEEFLKYLIQYVLKNFPKDMQFLSERREKEQNDQPQEERDSHNLLDKLHLIMESDFERITYTEALNILAKSKPAKKGKFQYPIEPWGVELQSEHERYLVEKEFKKPVILTGFPEKSKAFYMKRDKNNTVRAMDILFPQIGEIIGGSQREDNLEILKEKMLQSNIDEKELWWYLDLRRFGGAPHSGFGLGFERFVQFITGMNNIRDVIAFPRTPGNLNF